MPKPAIKIPSPFTVQPLDLTTFEGIEEARTSLTRILREVQHALLAIEVINASHQMVSGLLTTEEFLRWIKEQAEGLPEFQSGDLDYITGLRRP